MTNPSPINLGKIICDWINVHVSTFKALINSTVYLSGGVAHALTTPRAVVCFLKMRPNWKGNPAAPFRLFSFELVHRDEVQMLSSQWDGLMESRQKSLDGPFNLEHNPTMAGVIPIVFCVKDNSGFVVNNYFPVYRTRGVDDTALDSRTRVALFALNLHCKRCLDSGLVYEKPKKTGEGDEEVALDLGRYAQRGKKWKWERHPRDDPELM